MAGQRKLAMNDSALLRLEWSIRALAQDADEQLRLYPSFACVADELALEFEETMTNAKTKLTTLPPDVLTLIGNLDRHLDTMSGSETPEKAALWTDEGMFCAAEWDLVRTMARQILQEAEWPTTPPPPVRALYVRLDS